MIVKRDPSRSRPGLPLETTRSPSASSSLLGISGDQKPSIGQAPNERRNVSL